MILKKIFFVGIVLFFGCTLAQHCFGQEGKLRFYVGTYTVPSFPGKGIYAAEFDVADGSFSDAKLLYETAFPAFLIRHPKKPLVYAIGEVWDTQKGPVHVFEIEPASGGLRHLQTQTVPGLGPTHLSVCSGKNGESLVVACYGSGNVVALPILPDGTLGGAASSMQPQGSGPNKARQEGPHAHGAYFDGKTVYVPDLGTDKVMLYDIDLKTSTLSPHSQSFVAMPPGSGPRHLDFADGGKRIYVINELDSTVSLLTRNAAGLWEVVQSVSTLPKEVFASPETLAKLNNSTAEIAVHPSGKFVYASNRGHDSVAVFSVEERSGKITLIQTESTRGKTPRHFAIAPGGRWLLAANQDSGSVFAYRIDPESGRLTPVGDGLSVGGAVCILF